MTPPNELSGFMQNVSPQQPSATSPNSLGLQSQPQVPAARELNDQIAPAIQLLSEIATQFPEMSTAVNVAIEALKEGMTRTISTMQSGASEGGVPAYA